MRKLIDAFLICKLYFIVALWSTFSFKTGIKQKIKGWKLFFVIVWYYISGKDPD